MSDESERVRLAAVAELGALATTPQERFDRITRVAKQLLDVPSAEINIVEETTQFTKSPDRGPRSSRIARADSLCDVTVRQSDILVVEDASADPRFADRGSVAGSPHIRFYAGRPLSIGDGATVGTLCVFDEVVRDLSPEQLRVLEELGRWAERELRDIAALTRAADLQRRLRPAPLQSDDWSVAGSTLPALDVAGDYVSWRSTASGLSLELVDVMGKGTGAAIIASAVRSAYQARPSASPVEAARDVNAQLYDDFSVTGTFATAFVAHLDRRSGLLTYVDAGHGLTLLLRADGSTERLATAGLPLGIADDAAWECGERLLGPGDILFSCSDGLLDLYDGSLDALDSIADSIRRLDDADLFARLAELAESGDAQDDVTALVLRRRS